MKIELDNGKYTIIGDVSSLKALRYDEEWRDLTGDNLIYWLAVELEAARREIKKLKFDKVTEFIRANG